MPKEKEKKVKRPLRQSLGQTKKINTEKIKKSSKIVGSTEGRKDVDERKGEVYRRIEKRTRFARGKKRKWKEEEELDVRLVSIRRVAKARAGGKRLRLSVMVVVGDKAGRVGIAVAKGRDVKGAQAKAVNKAKKKMIKVSLRGQTIPHTITSKFRAARVFLKPAAPGTGVIAGGPVRAVVEAAGIKDILSKELGSKNPIPNVYATYKALKNLRLVRFEDET